MSKPLAIALLLGLVVTVHGRSLFFGMVYEDLNDAGAMLQDDTAKHLDDVLVKPLRSLTPLSYDLNRALWGVQPWGYHLGNVCVHLVNVLLLFAVLSRLGETGVALFLAAVFAVHPLLTEAVSYVSARSDLLSTGGLLLAVWAASVGSVAGAVVGVVCAVLAKETAVVAWGLVPLWAWWTRAPFPALKWAMYGVAVIVGVWVGTRLAVQVDWWSSREALMATWAYTVALIWPLDLSIEHDWTALRAWTGPVLAGLVGATVWALYKAVWRPWWAFGILWTLIALSPRYVVPAYEGLHERHFYPVVVGWCLGVGYWLSLRRHTETPSWL